MVNKYLLDDCMNEFNNSHMYYKHDNFYNNKKIDYLRLDCQRMLYETDSELSPEAWIKP